MSTAPSSYPTSWEEISFKAQGILKDSIPSEWRIPTAQQPPKTQANVTSYPRESGLLDAEEIAITESSATDLVQKLAAGELTSVQVTTAFCKRAALAQQLTNCLTVIMFDDALKLAQRLDDHLRETKQPVGPLHGLPVSLKDGFNIPGYPSSVGFTAWALDPVESESSIVTVLKSLGAVPYVKTNVPTAMMIAESVNNVYDRTVNPWNRNLTSGGSSGGESALIAFGGSCLGVGTDIGGSIRIPSSCTGIFGLKPSLGRFPHFDARTGLAGQESIASVQGPMSRTLSDLALFSRAVVSAEPWLYDPKAIPIPWRDVTLPTRLKIAVLTDNGLVKPTPPIARALETVSQRLAQAGHEIVPWEPTDHDEAVRLMQAFFLSDGGASIGKLLAETQEPWRPEMSAYAEVRRMDVYDLWQRQRERTALQKRYLDRVRGAGIDAILGPVTPYVAPKHGELKSVHYTGVFNILDYSSISFPTGLTADRELDRPATSEDRIPYNEIDERAQRQYDAELIHGLPISLQLTAGRLEEEKLLAMTEKVLEAIAVE